MAMKIIFPALEGYQRPWRNYRVDKNLNDHWLERLNNLKVFYPVNVCEGHVGCEDDSLLIVLLSKRNFLRGFDRLIHRPSLVEAVGLLVPSGTIYKLSTTFAVSNENDQFDRHLAKLSLRRETPRSTLEFFEEDGAWFDAAVAAVESIDLLCLEMLENVRTS